MRVSCSNVDWGVSCCRAVVLSAQPNHFALSNPGSGRRQERKRLSAVSPGKHEGGQGTPVALRDVVVLHQLLHEGKHEGAEEAVAVPARASHRAVLHLQAAYLVSEHRAALPVLCTSHMPTFNHAAAVWYARIWLARMTSASLEVMIVDDCIWGGRSHLLQEQTGVQRCPRMASSLPLQPCVCKVASRSVHELI